MFVKVDFPLHAEHADTDLPRFLQRVLQQFDPVALAFVVEVDVLIEPNVQDGSFVSSSQAISAFEYIP